MTKTISAITFLMAFAFSGAASAATIHTGSQAGLYDISPLVLTTNNNTASLSLEGKISPHTSVTFTYALTSLGGTDGNGAAQLYGQGIYNFYQNNAGHVVYSLTEGYTFYYGTATEFALQKQETLSTNSGTYGDPSDLTSHKELMLLASAAGISPDGRSGTFTLTNTSNALVAYFTQFSSTVSGLQGASYTYQVTPLSSVPLPAAMPLFGGALLMLGAFRSKRKKS